MSSSHTRLRSKLEEKKLAQLARLQSQLANIDEEAERIAKEKEALLAALHEEEKNGTQMHAFKDDDLDMGKQPFVEEALVDPPVLTDDPEDPNPTKPPTKPRKKKKRKNKGKPPSELFF